MPDWLILITAIGGGTGLGAILNALFNARGQAYIQLNALVDQLQEDRLHDREALMNFSGKVDGALLHLQIEREYSSDLYAWGSAGGPPPPPARRVVQPQRFTEGSN